jgi:hypothetical protein
MLQEVVLTSGEEVLVARDLAAGDQAAASKLLPTLF